MYGFSTSLTPFFQHYSFSFCSQNLNQALGKLVDPGHCGSVWERMSVDVGLGEGVGGACVRCELWFE